MKKILVEIEKDYISFSLSLDQNLEDYNKTNVFSSKKFKFSDEYILDNIKVVGSLIDLLMSNLQINTVLIENNIIASTILKLLNYTPHIRKIYFQEDKPITYTECSLLLENKYINSINCYSMPEYIFDRFNTLKKIDVILRYEILSLSNFMETNNIHTYSDMYYKKEIYLNINLEKDDIEDIIAFLKINQYLKVIILDNYIYENIVVLLNTLKKLNKENIAIIINQNDDNKNILFNNIEIFRNLEDKYNVKIKINYSDQYKKDNYVKQININIIKIILLIILIVSITIFGIYLYLNEVNNRKINNINDRIEKIIEDETKEIDNNYIINEEIEKSIRGRAYYTNYSDVISKLESINSDTVGYIKINNTKVNYPVVQYSNNDYYMKHDFNKENNLAGWIFMDYRNSVNNLDDNTIIYGHNITKDKLMFGSLRYTLDESWYKNKDNQIITFNTKNNNMKWQIFSIYTIEETNDYLINNFSSKDSFKNYIERELERSIYNFEIEVKSEDKILTLSTCNKDDKHRLVIHAKLVGE